MSVSCLRVATATSLLISSARIQAFVPPRSMNDASLILPTTATNRHDGIRGHGHGGWLHIKSPWRTSDVEEKAKGASPAAVKTNGENGGPSSSGGLLRFFDDNASSNDGGGGGDQSSSKVKTTASASAKKGPLGFLRGDMSPLAMDDEWAFSLNSEDVSAAKARGGDDDDTGEEVAMMAGAGLVVALLVAGVTVLGMGAMENFR